MSVLYVCVHARVHMLTCGCLCLLYVRLHLPVCLSMVWGQWLPVQ